MLAKDFANYQNSQHSMTHSKGMPINKMLIHLANERNICNINIQITGGCSGRVGGKKNFPILTPTFLRRSLTILSADILADGVIGLDDVILLEGVVVEDRIEFVLFFSASILFGVTWSVYFLSFVVLFGVTVVVLVFVVFLSLTFSLDGVSVTDVDDLLSLNDGCLCRDDSAKSAFRSVIKTIRYNRYVGEWEWRVLCKMLIYFYGTENWRRWERPRVVIAGRLSDISWHSILFEHYYVELHWLMLSYE